MASSVLLTPTAATVHTGTVTASTTGHLNYNESNSNTDFVTNVFLQLIQYIDTEYGAAEWNLRYVAGITAIVLFAVKLTLHKRGGIDWYALLHSIVSATGAFICFYLNEYAATDLTGMTEPYRSLQCNTNALTSIHRIIPAVTMGYAVIDSIDGIFFYGSIDFIIHGIATFAVLYYFVEQVHVPQLIAPMLILECSTVFLNVLGLAPLLPSVLSVLLVASFAAAFFIFRICIFPYIHIRLMMQIIEQQSTDNYCLPKSFFWVALLFGMTFHGLNFFWFYKIMLKLQRKIKGVEKFTDKNSCADYNDHEKKDQQQQQQKEQGVVEPSTTPKLQNDEEQKKSQ